MRLAVDAFDTMFGGEDDDQPVDKCNILAGMARMREKYESTREASQLVGRSAGTASTKRGRDSDGQEEAVYKRRGLGV
jgi:hypothetical protein